MDYVHLQQWMEHPEMLNVNTLHELRGLLERYPYFQLLRLLYLKNLHVLHDPGFASELRKTVPYVADRRMLFYLIEGEHYELLSCCGVKAPMVEEPTIDRTLSLINAFLATAPQEHSRSIPLDYTMDYTGYLMQVPDEGQTLMDEDSSPSAPKLRGHELIDGFIKEQEESGQPFAFAPNDVDEVKGTSSTDVSTVDLDDSCFTETLAKIYIKQQRYEKALEIIRKLSLNYPKKNAYFAGQIKALEELITNAKSK